MVEVETGVEVLEDVREILSEEVQCEVIGHGLKDLLNAYVHDDGPAKWYSIAKCSACGYSESEASCQRYYEVSHDEEIMDGMLYCPSCGETYTVRDMLTWVPR